MIKNERKCCRWSRNLPCLKFLLTAIISLIVLGFAIGMLCYDQFKTNSLTTFCSSLITSVVSFWFEPPNVYEAKPDEFENVEV